MTQTAGHEDQKDIHVASASQFLARAVEAFREENFPQAEVILRQLLAARPDVAAGWHLRGLTARATGDRRHALEFFLKAVSIDPTKADYCAALGDVLENLGRDADAVVPWQQAVASDPGSTLDRVRLADLLTRLGNHDAAMEHYDFAAGSDPTSFTAQYAYGLALARRENFEQAVVVFRLCLALDPENSDAHFQCGRCLQTLDRYDEAIVRYNACLAYGSDRPEAHINLAEIYRNSGRPAEAIEQCEAALDRYPDSVSALNNLGLALCDLGQHATAATFLKTAHRAEPDNPVTLHNLGVTLHACGALAESEQFLRQALDLRPDWPDAARSLGNLYRETGRLAKAAALYRNAIDRHPDDFRTFGNLGLVLLNLNQPHDAITAYEKALALNPSHAGLRTSLGIAQLLVGDFENGWRNYEARWESTDFAPAKRQFPIPRWRGRPTTDTGREPRPLLVHAEQGYGDTLHFCRYIPLLAAENIPVVFECQAPLVDLMQSLADVDDRLDLTVVARGDALPEAADHVPLLSLPAHFSTKLETVPADVPYLKAPRHAVETWTHRMAGDGPAVGLVWAGNAERQDDWMRSCPPDAMVPLVETDAIRFYSLQKNGPQLENSTVVPLGPQLASFSDTAAVIETLDLVISVDTATAHLAGALGKPVWVLLGPAADWRYLLDRQDSPWYPTMRLFRSPDLGDWSAVMDQVADTLRSCLSHRDDGGVMLKC